MFVLYTSVVAAGWLVSTLAGAAAGGATGSVIGALTQAGVSKNDADIYAEGLRRGGAVVSARLPDADAARLQAVMDRSADKYHRERRGLSPSRMEVIRCLGNAVHSGSNPKRARTLWEAITNKREPRNTHKS